MNLTTRQIIRITTILTLAGWDEDAIATFCAYLKQGGNCRVLSRSAATNREELEVIADYLEMCRL